MRQDLIFCYATAHNPRTNPHGNPFGITLPVDVAQKQLYESVDEYRKRIANEITIAKYPRLRVAVGQ